ELPRELLDLQLGQGAAHDLALEEALQIRLPGRVVDVVGADGQLPVDPRDGAEILALDGEEDGDEVLPHLLGQPADQAEVEERQAIALEHQDVSRVEIAVEKTVLQEHLEGGGE